MEVVDALLYPLDALLRPFQVNRYDRSLRPTSCGTSRGRGRGRGPRVEVTPDPRSLGVILLVLRRTGSSGQTGVDSCGSTLARNMGTKDGHERPSFRPRHEPIPTPLHPSVRRTADLSKEIEEKYSRFGAS